MNVNSNDEQTFLDRLNLIAEANMTNEQFGVSELARELGMSRSYVYRRLKKLTGLSVSRFIRKIRLEKAMELLTNNNTSASEVAYDVGFSSATYFNHCFHEYFGYPPGEVKKRINKQGPEKSAKTLKSNKNSYRLFKIISLRRFRQIKVLLAFLIALLIGTLLWIVLDSRELSIVVLPIKSLSDEQSVEFYAERIREDILFDLYNIREINPVSRTSADQFEEGNYSVRKIFRKANANNVLESSILKFGDSIRVNARLFHRRLFRETAIMSEYYDRKISDVVGIQDEIVLDIASKLNATLSDEELSQIKKLPTQNVSAYENYSHARYLMYRSYEEHRNDFVEEGVKNSVKYFEKAVAEDNNFAEAYAGWANASFNLSAWGYIPPYVGFPKAKELSRKALEIDPECAEAHAVLGAYYVWAERNFERGGNELQMALQLDPNFATSHQWYAQYLMITGPIELARFHINRALDLEYYFWVIQNLDAYIAYFEKNYEDAIDACIVAESLKPGFIDNYWLYVLNYAKLDEGEKTVEYLQKIAGHVPGSESYVDEIAQVYQKAGIEGLFVWLIEINKNRPIKVDGMNGHPFYIAWWNAILGNHEEAIYWLEKILERKNRLYVYSNLILTNPDFQFLNDDPRFLKFADEIDLTPYLRQNGILTLND